jgi:Arc/MetJ-type ribon-helix-helix transcriptional regulator
MMENDKIRPIVGTSKYYRNAISIGDAVETTLTLKFRGVEAALLDEMISSGLFNTKSEAIRSAIVKFGLDLGLLKRKKLWADIRRHPPRKVSASRLKKDLERIKDET